MKKVICDRVLCKPAHTQLLRGVQYYGNNVLKRKEKWSYSLKKKILLISSGSHMKEVKCQRNFLEDFSFFTGREKIRGCKKIRVWRKRKIKTTCNWELQIVTKKHWGHRIWNWKWMLNETLINPLKLMMIILVTSSSIMDIE